MLRVRAHVFSRHFILSAAAFMAIGLLTSCSSKKENTSPPNTETEVQSQAFKENTQTAGRTSEEQEQKQDRALREEQLSAATKLIETFPGNDNVTYLIGLIYNEQGNSSEAIKYWEECLEINKERHDTLNSLGHALLLREEYERAAELLSKALSLNPKFYEARYNLADTFMHKGKPEEVIATLGKDLSPNPGAYQLLGQAHQQLGDFENAKKYYLLSVKLEEDFSKAYYGLIATCINLGEREEAKKYRDKFSELKNKEHEEGRDWRKDFNPLEITRKSVSHTHTDIARLYQMENRLEKAIELFNRALILDPENEQCLAHLGTYWTNKRKPEEALRYFEKLIQLKPEKGLYYFHAGMLNAKLQRSPSAEKMYRKAIELGPRQAAGYGALAILLAKTKETLPEALSLIQQAIDLDPGNRNYRTIHRNLINTRK